MRGKTGDQIASRMPSRTWPVFVIGLSTLLLLIGIPGILLMSRTEESFAEVRVVQQQYEEGQRILDQINAKIVNGSVLVREFLLDSSPLATEWYKKQFQQNRVESSALLARLRHTLPTQDYAAFERLEAEMRDHAAAVLPIFEWSPEERRERSTFFLRQQQRLRRESLLSTAGQLSELHRANYRRQQASLDASRRRFQEDLRKAVLVAVLLGLCVSAATVVRIYALERHTMAQQQATEQARGELQALSHQLIRAQEAERKSLSRELHDQVGQMLTALRMEIGAVERLRTGEEHRFAQHLSEAKALTERTLRTVRDIATQLRPSLLDDLGLVPALELETRDFTRRTETPVDLHVSGDLDDLPDAHRICVFRVVQEALTNCARHAQAQAVTISLRCAEGRLLLDIRDDGIGCESRTVHQGSIGLRGLQERVRELDGVLTIHTAPGEGMRLNIDLPLVTREVTA